MLCLLVSVHSLPLFCCLPLSILDPVTDKFTESVYVLANEPSVALYRLQEHVRRSLPELAQHKVSPMHPCHQPLQSLHIVSWGLLVEQGLLR